MNKLDYFNRTNMQMDIFQDFRNIMFNYLVTYKL